MTQSGSGLNIEAQHVFRNLSAIPLVSRRRGVPAA
jgi:hypothetical protein